MQENNGVKIDTIIRTICLVLALVNQILIAFGKQALPISDEEVYTLVSTIVTIAVAIWTWWKNNSFTPEAIKADEYLAKLRKGGDAE